MRDRTCRTSFTPEMTTSNCIKRDQTRTKMLKTEPDVIPSL